MNSEFKQQTDLNIASAFEEFFVQRTNSNMDSASPVSLEFFYDIISPYSYFTFEILRRYKSTWNMEIKLRPIFLMDLLKISKNHVTLSENKRAYIGVDLRRLQNYYHLPINLPQNLMDLMHNDYTIKAQKFITAVDIIDSKYTEDITEAVWKCMFQTRKDVSTVEVLKEAAESTQMDANDIVKAIGLIEDPGTKERLDLYTQQAYEHGGFGAPTIIATVNGKNELFFGADRLELLAHALGKKWEGPRPVQCSYIT